MNQNPHKPLKSGDVYPAHILRDEYGMNADNRPYFKVIVEDVPIELRELIPFVERWAIPCDVTRGDYFENQPEEDVADFYYRVLPFTDQIEAWLDEQPADVNDWPEAAVHYMYFLKAHSEAYQPTEEEKKAHARRLLEWEHLQAFNSAVSESEEAFKLKDYARVVQLLSPFEDELLKISATKLKLARKKQ
ncbi:MAG TPA: hypothetical protein DCY03_08790 [Planctomycetaceae bacterium]|nr:hypothetical protein [Planctomycetaceae bacterium]|tara:strand:- start:10633 stop:11202 length:570 start_codon:yes stop_codon:yes gene_type:complete